MRAALVILMMVGGSLSTGPVLGSDVDPDAHPACRSPDGWGCSVSDVRAASKARLRKAGSVITVSCAPRLEETPVDAVYMQDCVERVRDLAAFLSKKWSAVLQPVDASLIRYDWNKSFGCFTVMLEDGGMSGSCPVYGEARIPLTWRDAASAASGVE